MATPLDRIVANNPGAALVAALVLIVIAIVLAVMLVLLSKKSSAASKSGFSGYNACSDTTSRGASLAELQALTVAGGYTPPDDGRITGELGRIMNSG
jgi:hypothetical protein